MPSLRLLLLLLSLSLLGCGAQPEAGAGGEAEREGGEVWERFGGMAEGGDFELMEEAEAGGWRARRVEVPRYFQVEGWMDRATLWGLARGRPVEVRVDGAGEPTGWPGVSAWGASLAPDGRRLAWVDERGVHVSARGEGSRLVLARDTTRRTAREIVLPPAHRVTAGDTSRILLVESDHASGVHRIALRTPTGTRPFAVTRGEPPRLLPSPDPRRLALTSGA